MIFDSSIMRGRSYLVTGATGGAGKAVATLISKCGGTVMLIGRDPERTEKVRLSLAGMGHSSKYVAFVPDVQLAAGWFRECVGPFDGIFHAAGEELIAPVGMLNGTIVGKAFGPSLYAAIGLLTAVGARKDSILKDGGAVVMMSSVAAVCGTSGMSAYSASKGAIESLVPSAAVELAPRRIRVNAIRAGAFDSPMHARICNKLTEQGMNDYAAKHPLGFGKADDIAQMAVYLMSDAGRWITGTCVTVDGGMSA